MMGRKIQNKLVAVFSTEKKFFQNQNDPNFSENFQFKDSLPIRSTFAFPTSTLFLSQSHHEKYQFANQFHVLVIKECV